VTTDTMTFDTPGAVLLRISLDGGEVGVETWDERRVDVQLIALRDNDITRQVIEEARVEMSPRGGGHEIVVDLKRKSGLALGRGPKVGVRVRCPEDSDLALRSSSADLEATGRLGSAEVKTASGDVHVEEVARLDVDTASGDVRARALAGAADVRTASGDMSLGRCNGMLSANLVSGDLYVEDAAAGLAVTTVSGDVQVRAGGGGSIRVQSVSGDVELAIKPGQRLYVDASSVSGTMSSELGLDDTPPVDPGTSVSDLRVRTISGDLNIIRAAVGV
jgi:hypothetical protein